MGAADRIGPGDEDAAAQCDTDGGDGLQGKLSAQNQAEAQTDLIK